MQVSEEDSEEELDTSLALDFITSWDDPKFPYVEQDTVLEDNSSVLVSDVPEQAQPTRSVKTKAALVKKITASKVIVAWPLVKDPKRNTRFSKR